MGEEGKVLEDVLSWREAYEAGVAPPIFLESTHENALMFVSLEALKKNAIDFKSH